MDLHDNKFIQNISLTISKGRQSISYQEVLRYNKVNQKLKIEILSDSYLEQSYARVHLWSGTKWELIHAIPYSLMKTPCKLIYNETNNHNDVTAETLMKNNKNSFMKDRNTLFDIAKNIIL